ncbi:MAG: InlB B-repeat-containing protein, partial [Acidimicrobiales bacterium]
AGAFAYVSDAGSPPDVSVIQLSTNTVVQTITVGNAPEGIIVNPADTFAYVVNFSSNNVSVIFLSNMVSFNANGGTGSMANETNSAPAALTPNSFTRSGYTFKNWNTAANGTGTAYANGASYPFSASTTLYARWTRKRH